MKYSIGLVLLVALACGHRAHALELPDIAPTNMNLTIMVQTKEPMARYRLSFMPDGKINLFAFDHRNMETPVTLRNNLNGDVELRQKLYSLSKAAIDSFQVDPTKDVPTKNEGGRRKSYAVSIVMRINSQMISVGDLVIDDLSAMPTFKALVGEINKEFPELKDWPKKSQQKDG